MAAHHSAGRPGGSASRRQRRVAAAALAAVACAQPSPGDGDAAPSTAPNASGVPSEPPPKLLYLPDAELRAPLGTPPSAPPLAAPVAGSRRCPPEMVDVRGEICVDRWEASLVDVDQSREFSPFYPPGREATKKTRAAWSKLRGEMGPQSARAIPLPVPPAWQLLEEVGPRAVSRAGVVPNGYLTADVAERACRSAGKRLCTAAEWIVACRGEQSRKFPYGDRYEQGRCNVFREAHPADLLHGNASIGHLDPRLNAAKARGKPLLRRTGETPDCASRWGADAIYDMVGNLDEWVDDPKGRFLGGFYSRSTREGCDASVSSHPRSYWDYSLGARCCR